MFQDKKSKQKHSKSTAPYGWSMHFTRWKKVMGLGIKAQHTFDLSLHEAYREICPLSLTSSRLPGCFYEIAHIMCVSCIFVLLLF